MTQTAFLLWKIVSIDLYRSWLLGLDCVDGMINLRLVLERERRAEMSLFDREWWDWGNLGTIYCSVSRTLINRFRFIHTKKGDFLKRSSPRRDWVPRISQINFTCNFLTPLEIPFFPVLRFGSQPAVVRKLYRSTYIEAATILIGWTLNRRVRNKTWLNCVAFGHVLRYRPILADLLDPLWHSYGNMQ
jgi:hypothetical protein